MRFSANRGMVDVLITCFLVLQPSLPCRSRKPLGLHTALSVGWVAFALAHQPQNPEPQPKGDGKPNTPGTQGGPPSLDGSIEVRQDAAASLCGSENKAAQTPILVRINSEINLRKAKRRDTFEGSLASDLTANGKLIARKGSLVKGELVAPWLSDMQSASELILRLKTLKLGGEYVSIWSCDYLTDPRIHRRAGILGDPTGSGGSSTDNQIVPSGTVLKFVAGGESGATSPATPKKQ